jgi:oligopeptidase B
MRRILLPSLTLFIMSCKNDTTHNQTYNWPDVKAPVAIQKEHIRTIHGDTVNDPYYWMYDYFGKGPDSSNVIHYLKEENAYTDTMLAGTKSLQENLFKELKGRIKEKDESAPVLNNGYYYYTRTEDGKQYYKYCRKKGSLNAAEEILLDVDQMAEGKPYYALSGFNISDDNKLLAFGVPLKIRREILVLQQITKPFFIHPITLKRC